MQAIYFPVPLESYIIIDRFFPIKLLIFSLYVKYTSVQMDKRIDNSHHTLSDCFCFSNKSVVISV